MAYDKALLDKAAAETGFEPALLERLIAAESAGDPRAVSPKGATGLTQLSEAAAQDEGVTDRTDPAQSILGGAKYLRAMVDRFGSLPLGLAAYNMGPGALEKAGRVIPVSVKPYVEKVAGNMPEVAATTQSAEISAMDKQIQADTGAYKGAISDFGAAAKDYDKAFAEVDPRIAQRQKQAEADLADIRKIWAERPSAPAAQRAPTYVPPPIKDPVETLMKVMPLMLLAGSKMGRNKGLALMNSTAAVLKGAHDQNAENRQQAREDARTHLDEFIEQAKVDHDRYMDILNDTNMSTQERIAEIQVLAAQNQSEQLRLAGPEQKLKMAHDFAAMLGTVATQAMSIRREMANDEIRRLSKVQVLHDPKTNADYRYNLLTGEATTLTGEPYSPQGAAKIPSGAPRSASAMATQRFLQEHPDATAEDVSQFGAKYARETAAAKAFATGKQGQMVNSFNVAINHLDTLEELMKALQNGDVKTVNALSQGFQAEFGQAAPTNFDAAKRIVSDEIVKAIVGTGGALGDRESASATLSRANSPEQITGVISTYKKLMAGQLAGLKLQYKSATGLDDFDEKLSDRTKQELETAQPDAPPIGTVMDGHRYKGGDPRKSENWEPVN